MAVTKLPRTRKGILSRGPPLSWPNDTTLGPRRPRLGLLRQATHNSQQHRISNLSASPRHNVPRPTHPSSLRSQPPRASGSSRYKAHKRTHGSKQHSKTPTVSGNPPKQNENPVIQNPPPHPTQLPEVPHLSSTSLTANKQAANPPNANHHKHKPPPPPSHPSSSSSNPPQTTPHPPPPRKPINWPAYARAKAHRLKQIRIWISTLHRAHRIVDSVAKELMAYYGSEEKYGNHPSARSLSKHAWEAVRLCEVEFGTDLAWGRGLGERVWGSECGKVERLIEGLMEGDGGGERFE
ncbi:hypothetical protein IMSHALPRED_009980 [Imshaugia aleurites]|uniref:Uncharacterized protein n=1 Tax=Imshaugia aleurites TaxID=172621 RepID=A0A8H3ES80_9LECA|nr:hypothetical protein IMSHALPRED_009980 [Imshaugia aleurites]